MYSYRPYEVKMGCPVLAEYHHLLTHRFAFPVSDYLRCLLKVLLGIRNIKIVYFTLQNRNFEIRLLARHVPGLKFS